jgi:hypothetical protein
MSKIQRAVCGIGLLLLAVTLHRLLFQSREIIPGVTSRPFGLCNLDWFSHHFLTFFTHNSHKTTIDIHSFLCYTVVV